MGYSKDAYERYADPNISPYKKCRFCSAPIHISWTYCDSMACKDKRREEQNAKQREDLKRKKQKREEFRQQLLTSLK